MAASEVMTSGTGVGEERRSESHMESTSDFSQKSPRVKRNSPPSLPAGHGPGMIPMRYLMVIGLHRTRRPPKGQEGASHQNFGYRAGGRTSEVTVTHSESREEPVTRPSLREYATVQRERYLAATRAEKGALLDEVVAVTRPHRTAASRFLPRGPPGAPAPPPPRPPPPLRARAAAAA